ncbi:hypothetical protein F2P56_033684 [Juglans regia]|uniref:Protein SET DOMAIN GROUP 41-like n=2 Tax=Juglans regia TaxID=51240 RepID=A0A2I4GJY1_JUGRE|nr:protein SET DOMAIN GROUP 41-like [Juglans regia]KAF5444560.1 hypothetical protein F2P56_033684 [Juglans regia]
MSCSLIAEMEMRGSEDVEMGQDITPPFPPLSFSLHDSFLLSHCSACFSPLPLRPTFPHIPLPLPPYLLSYCSPRCSSSDSPLHFSSAEFHLLRSHPSSFGESSDLRAALRFLHSLPASCRSVPNGRLAGLLTNRDKLLARTGYDEEFVERIRDGARVMAAARKMREGYGSSEPNDFVLEEAALCLVLTNAVEVQDDSGRTLGIAVYDPSFSWINHSCSPNASYRFFLSSPPPCCAQARLRIVPCARHGLETQIESGVCSISELSYGEMRENNGPKVVVRSIKRIKKGEEVTVAYTDLLHPKEMRQLELWSKYWFICCCRRCSSSHLTYVDHILQEVSPASLQSSSLLSGQDIYINGTIESLTDHINDAITEYLESGDSESCCKKLEDMLTQGLLYEQLGGREEKSQPVFKLHPLHYLSLNAYTTLVSAYKVRASDLLTLYSGMEEHHLEALDLSRISAAYSLLLAGATHHLFQSEPSLIASVANFWIGAGESLLTLARSSVWSIIVKCGLPATNLSYTLSKHICSKCSLMQKFIAILHHREVQSTDLENISSEFFDCVTNITQTVWGFLIHGCQYLRAVKDPIEFSWLGTRKDSSTRDIQPHLGSSAVVSYHGDEGSFSVCEAHTCIFQVGVHCLLYGGYLACICYGQHSNLITHIRNILDPEECLINRFHETDK